MKDAIDPDPAELAELRLLASAWAPDAAPVGCPCDHCEAGRRERRRALAPSRLRPIDPEDVSDDSFERFLPERRK